VSAISVTHRDPLPSSSSLAFCLRFVHCGSTIRSSLQGHLPRPALFRFRWSRLRAATRSGAFIVPVAPPAASRTIRFHGSRPRAATRSGAFVLPVAPPVLSSVSPPSLGGRTRPPLLLSPCFVAPSFRRSPRLVSARHRHRAAHASVHRAWPSAPVERSGRLVFSGEGESDEGDPGRSRPDLRFSRSR
jgi:hypothetical protein